MPELAPLTDLIHRAQGGDKAALGQVFALAYADLRALARSRLSRSAPNTLLDTTSLVHESFLRFVNTQQLKIDDRNHFLRYAAHVIRSVVIDHVRERHSARRGGQAARVTLNTAMNDALPAGEEEILNVHEALEDIARYEPRLVEVVEMRYFAGLTEAEIAAALGITDRTVRRDWKKAQLLLAAALAPPSDL
ncbi:MAG: sigma-70 family RNA polymerase sigma factor [Pseudomonadales bacterium]|nr:sigma-70 family RNA polymerase sigma factor [Pseudomonadales bacterium]